MASANVASRRGVRWPGLIGLLVSIILLWWTLHDVALANVWQHLRNIHVASFVGAVVLATAVFPIRTIRWRYVLRLEGSPLPFRPLWHATAIGFMANNLLPARAGEVARAYAARKLTSVRFSTAFASIAVERVLDGMGVVGLFALAVWAGGFSNTTTVGGISMVAAAKAVGAVFLGAFVVAVLLVHWPDPARRLATAIAHRVLPHRWANRVLETIEGLLAGLDALRDIGRFLRALFWTLVVWLVNGASFWLCFIAFDLDLPVSAALLVQGIIAFGVALPSSPGFFGPFEAACRLALALYGVQAERAVSYAVGYHFATFIPITVLGLWSLSRAHLHLADLRTAGGDEEGTMEREAKGSTASAPSVNQSP